MLSIWANFDHLFEVLQGLFFAFLLAKRCAGDEVDFDKNGMESKMENTTHSFREMNLALQLI